MSDLLDTLVDARPPRNGFECNGTAKDSLKRPCVRAFQRKRPLSNAISNKPRRTMPLSTVGLITTTTRQPYKEADILGEKNQQPKGLGLRGNRKPMPYSRRQTAASNLKKGRTMEKEAP